MTKIRIFAARYVLLAACAAALPAFQAVPGAQAPAAEERCSVEGRVVNAANGEPLNKSSVLLQRTDGARSEIGKATGSALPQLFSTTTDATGRFAMKNIDPGGYRLQASRAGFVTAEYGAKKLTGSGTLLTLVAGRAVKDITVRLTPHGVVAGRIQEEDGEPVTSASVQLLRLRYQNGKKQLQATATATTNDLGEYRAFGIPPGKYYVFAIVQGTDANSVLAGLAVDRSATPRPEENYVATYYPGTPDPAAAVPLEVAAASQIRGIDMTLAKRRTFSIRGRVSPAGTMMILAPRSLAGALSLKVVRLDPKGEFEIHGVAPGSYALTTSARIGNKAYSASMPLEVGSTNIEGINFVVGTGVPVTGRLRVDGETTEDLSRVQVRTQPRQMGIGAVLGAMGSMMAGGAPGENLGKLDKDLAFRLEEVSADLYDVQVSGLPDGFYVKSIRSGETNIQLAGLEVTGSSPEPVEIVVSPRAGQIGGAVQNPAGQPAPEAVVALVPQEKERRDSAAYYRQATTDAGGRFTFKDLPPGSYKVFAWDDVESGAWMDPDFLKPLEAKGEAVTVKEGGQETVQVKVIAADAAPEKPNR